MFHKIIVTIFEHVGRIYFLSNKIPLHNEVKCENIISLFKYATIIITYCQLLIAMTHVDDNICVEVPNIVVVFFTCKMEHILSSAFLICSIWSLIVDVCSSNLSFFSISFCIAIFNFSTSSSFL